MTYEDEARVQEEEFEDWVLIGNDWWQLAYGDVEWRHRARYHWTETGFRLTFHPRPPQYHEDLYNVKGQYGLRGPSRQDVDLDRSLVGVKGAEDALGPYERHVGICDTSSEVSFTAQLWFPDDTKKDIARRSREQWKRHVDALLGGVLEPSCIDLPPLLPDERVPLWNLDAIDDPYYDGDSHMSTSPDVGELSYSDISVDSDPLPTTPQGDKKSYAEVLFDDRGTPTHCGTVISPSPSKPLNASALAFIPGYVLDHQTPSPPSADMPYVSPTYEFHFPSLNSHATSRNSTRSLPPPLQRDENGFYTEVPSAAPQTAAQSRSATPKRSSSGSNSVPSFLGNAQKQSSSKTREMVDRLRSNNSGSPRRHRKSKGENSALRHSVDATVPQTEKDADGWITGIEHVPKRSRSQKSEDWVQGLFQCRQPTKSRQKEQLHARSSSTATNASSTQTPPTPSSVSSSLSTLPSPTSSNFSNPRTPTTAQFPLSQYYSFQPPYGTYPGSYPMPPGPTMQMVPAPWQIVPAHAAYVMPPPIYSPGASPYDTRKAAPVGGARHA